MLEAKLSTAKVLNNIYKKKVRIPTGASAMAEVDNILKNDNEEEQEKALIELAQALEKCQLTAPAILLAILLQLLTTLALIAPPS